MSIKDNLSKKNTSLLLMTALIIGIIVVITQLASAGSQKNENPSIQNINLNDSSKYKSVLNMTNTTNSNATKPAVQAPNTDNATKPAVQAPNTDNATKPAVQAPNTDNATKPAVQAPNTDNATKPAVQAPNTDNATKPAVQAPNTDNATKPAVQAPNTDNATKPAVQAPNSILGIINASTKNNSEIVSLQTIKIPKADQISNKKDSETKPNSKTKSSDENSEIKNKLQSQHKNKDSIALNNADKKTKDKAESKTKNSHKSKSLKEDYNTPSHSNHKINKPTIESIPSQSFDLPFTAIVPKDLF